MFVAAQRRAVGRVSELIVARFVVAELVAVRVYAELVVARVEVPWLYVPTGSRGRRARRSSRRGPYLGTLTVRTWEDDE